MKVQIELSQIEQLKKTIEEQSTKINRLENELNNLKPEKLREQAFYLSKQLFNKYMDATFKGLGFNDTYEPIIIDHKISRNDQWWEKDNYTFNLSATISKEIQSAYLKIGIDTEVIKQKPWNEL